MLPLANYSFWLFELLAKPIGADTTVCRLAELEVVKNSFINGAGCFKTSLGDLYKISGFKFEAIIALEGLGPLL